MQSLFLFSVLSCRFLLHHVGFLFDLADWCAPCNTDVPPDVANVDAPSAELDDSVPPVPVVAPVPPKDFIPLGNGPGRAYLCLRTTSSSTPWWTMVSRRHRC